MPSKRGSDRQEVMWEQERHYTAGMKRFSGKVLKDVSANSGGVVTRGKEV